MVLASQSHDVPELALTQTSLDAGPGQSVKKNPVAGVPVKYWQFGPPLLHTPPFSTTPC